MCVNYTPTRNDILFITVEAKQIGICEKWYILPVISGVLLALTLPPFNISLFVWVGFVPLLIFSRNPTLPMRRVFEGGLVTGILYAVASVYPLSTVRAWWWFDVSGIVSASKVIFLFWILFFIVVCASILFGLFVLAYRKWSRNNLIDAVVFAGLWTIFEYGRAVLFAGFTWGHIGYALFNETYILQLAYFGGVYALGFFAVFVNVFITFILNTGRYAQLFFGRSFRDTLYDASCGICKNRYFYVLIAIIVAVNTYGYGVVHNKKIENKSSITVTVIQTGVETDEITREGAYHVLDLMRKAADDNPDVVILPENVFPFLFIDEETLLPKGYGLKDLGLGEFYDNLLLLSRDHKNISFVLGVHTVTDNREYNSMISLENGKIVDIYNKRFLMPFSEGPLRWIPVGPVGTLETGDKKNFSFGGIEATPLICSEIIFPGLIERGIATPIISIGNDSVFKSPLIAEENHIMARVRAAEHRVYVVRAMKTGISSIINSYGKVVVQSKSTNEEMMTARIEY